MSLVLLPVAAKLTGLAEFGESCLLRVQGDYPNFIENKVSEFPLEKFLLQTQPIR